MKLKSLVLGGIEILIILTLIFRLGMGLFARNIKGSGRKNIKGNGRKNIKGSGRENIKGRGRKNIKGRGREKKIKLGFLRNISESIINYR